ncbi:hypothetical protein CR513_11645, partial [Mucuna pruriens]
MGRPPGHQAMLRRQLKNRLLTIPGRRARCEHPKCKDKPDRPLLAKDLKEVSIGPKPAHKTQIGTAVAKEDESRLVSFLWENRDVFTWSPTNMPEIDPDFLCHHLSVSPRSRLVVQRRRKLGEEKRKAA